MQIKNLVFSLVALSVIAGCNSEKRCQRRLSKLEYKCPGLFQVRDSVIYRKHDTIVYYHDTFTSSAQTHTDTFNIPCPDHATVIQHFKGGSATVSVQKGKVIVQCHEDSLKLVINRKDSIIYKQAIVIKTGLATSTITVPAPPTSWQGFCKWFTWIVLIGAGGYLGIKLFPKI